MASFKNIISIADEGKIRINLIYAIEPDEYCRYRQYRRRFVNFKLTNYGQLLYISVGFVKRDGKLDLTTLNKRLYWSALVLAAFVLLTLCLQLVTVKGAAERTRYVAAVATLPGQLHEPVSTYTIQHIAGLLQSLQLGGDLSGLGVTQPVPSLDIVLGEDRFDMDSTLALLEDKRIRPARAKIELLVAKVERANQRRGRLLSYLPWASIAGVLAILLFVSQAWWRSRSTLIDNIAAVDEPIVALESEAFDDYLAKVLDEEMAFTGFRAKLNCLGFDQVTLPSELVLPIETAAEQFLRNSIEHGGRLSEDRLMSHKPEFLSVDVSLTETDSEYQLTVRDDGEGIDETEVVLRAIKLGLLTAEAARKIPKGQGIKYIFMSGYSGEKQAFGVSENSIGLDQVRRLVKQSGGVTGLQNSPGTYCQFTIRFNKAQSGELSVN